MNATIDTTRLTLLLNELRLPAIKHLWEKFAERSDKEGWPAARLLLALAEHEITERDRRRIERHLGEAKLLPEKTLENFDFAAVPMISKAQVSALCAGDGWLEKGANLLMFGPPGGGKSHLASAIGLSLLEKGWRVLFTRTSDLVQKLQLARREFVLEAAIQRLDRYHLLVLDDLVYVTKDQAETSVLFELISARYERRSVLITANQPFGEWGKILPAMNEERQAYESRAARAMCTSHFANQYAGDTNPRGHLRSPLLELYVRSSQSRSKEKNRPPSFCRLRRQTAPGVEVKVINRRKRRLQIDRPCQRQSTAA